MSLSSLPLECLEVVLWYMHEHGDRSTLARLLQVNRFFCSATLPVLYGSVFSVNIQNRSWGHLEQHAVIQTLLRQQPRSQVSELLSAAYDVFPEQTGSPEVNDTTSPGEDQAAHDMPQASKIDYLSFIRHFNFEPDCYARLHGIPINWKTFYPRRLAHLALRSKRTPEDVDAEDLEAVVWKGEQTDGGNQEKDFVLAGNQYGDGVMDQALLFPTSAIAGPASWEALRYAALASSLRRDLTWTLTSPVFEQIQEIVLPLSDVERYLAVVDRFRSLTTVVFKVDMLLEPYVRGGAPIPQLTPALMNELNRARRKRNRQFKFMTEFVTRHAELFPGQLKNADCIDDHSWPMPARCPQLALHGLKDALPLIVQPRSIDESNWRRIASKIKLIDLSLVKDVHLVNLDRIAASKLNESDPTFLSRCRSLENLCMETAGPGSFQWAIKEKADLEEERLVSSSSSAATAQRLPHLVPLKTVVLTTLTMFKDELHHIAQAFGETLTLIDFSSLPRLILNTDNTTKFCFGRGWNLPRLQRFRLSVHRLRLLPDPDFYGDVVGQQLERLELLDNSPGLSRPQDIQDLQLCLPAAKTLPKLTYLNLDGWSSLSFHPDTLRHTPNLRSLRLTIMSGAINYHIPSDDELTASVLYQLDTSQEFTQAEAATGYPLGHIDSSEDNHHFVTAPRRPIWTWDWNLRRLVHLRLDGVIAFMFEFRMLVGCPVLQHMELNIGTAGNRKRILAVQDFILPASASPTSSSSSPSDSESNGSSSDSNDSSSSNNNTNGGPTFIAAPSIIRLSLQGTWIMEDSLRSEVFSKTFPNLESFREQLTQVSAIQSWLLNISCMPRLRKAFLTLSDGMLAHYSKAVEESGLVRNLKYNRRRTTPYCTEAIVNNEQETILYIIGRFWAMGFQAPPAPPVNAPVQL
ncbi:hypothetical protein EMPS_07100 [Entomortierella parvispora]|uniref:Uncharacterized protein n=1 Tax=Entomortierella parvispora TaxID=205924 RepID=A0A9P3HDQ0_9FUNG|nr:hypothetical protein EMPS_07100 [Entomortierella parvispora]